MAKCIMVFFSLSWWMRNSNWTNATAISLQLAACLSLIDMFPLLSQLYHYKVSLNNSIVNYHYLSIVSDRCKLRHSLMTVEDNRCLSKRCFRKKYLQFLGRKESFFLKKNESCFREINFVYHCSKFMTFWACVLQFNFLSFCWFHSQFSNFFVGLSLSSEISLIDSRPSKFHCDFFIPARRFWDSYVVT